MINDIDCSVLPNFAPIGKNSSLKFQGTFNGNYFSIFNISISVASNEIGIFGFVDSASLRNFYLRNILINSTASSNYVGALAGNFLNSQALNIQIFSSVITGNAASFCGGLFGYAQNSSANNITTENTLVNFPNCAYVGGFFGYVNKIVMRDCHNIGNFFFFLFKTSFNKYKGFTSNSSFEIVIGKDRVGGLLGFSNANLTMERSGVVGGKVSGSSQGVGGVVGVITTTFSTDFYFSEIYSKKEVQVMCSDLNCGGLIGTISLTDSSKLFVSNSYTRSEVKSSNGTVGGFFGIINFSSISASVNITNSYSSNFVFGSTNVSNSIGAITGNTATFISMSFYFNNQTNPSLPAIASGNSSYPNAVLGLNCLGILSAIQSFNSSIWGQDSLISEYNFNPSNTLCNISTTTPPSTNPPSTNPPSTMPPSTISPSTNEPSTMIPSTNSPSTNPPSTTESSTNYPTTVVPSTNPPSSTPLPNNCSGVDNCNGNGNCKRLFLILFFF